MTDGRAVTPRKRLGQHFLHDRNVVDKIVRAIRPEPGDQLVEVGPGTGALTVPLLEQRPDLIAVEVDPRAVDFLKGAHPALDVRQADVLDVDWASLADPGRMLYVVGNLPYNITTPILFGLFDVAGLVREVVFMMQLEVARRLVAIPRTKEYGILSVATQLVGRPELLFRISKNVFEPRPAVESALVRITFEDHRDDAVDPAFVRRVIRTAFNQRRKTLRNSLATLVPPGVSLPDQWSARRAEELSPADFLALAGFLNR